MMESILFSALDSLISNAFVHGKDGVSVKVVQNDGVVRVAIWSGGKTFGEQTVDEFIAARAAENKKSGLGLGIAQRFVKALGGELTLQAGNSGGLTFAFALEVNSQ